MKLTPINNEQQTRRRDIGSGVYWELLNAEFLDLFFTAGIKEKVLHAWGTKANTNTRVTWDYTGPGAGGIGMATIGSSKVLRVLVTTPEGCEKMRSFFDRHGGMGTITEKLANSEDYHSMQQAITHFFAKYVTLGIVEDYTSLEKEKFKQDHITDPSSRFAKRRLVSTHTVDTGKTVGIRLKSVITAVDDLDIPPSHPAMVRRDVLYSARNAGQYGNSFFRQSRVALARFLGNQEEPPSNRYYVDAFGDFVDRTSDFVVTDFEGKVQILRGTEQPTPPSLEIGGTNDTFRSTAESQNWETRNGSYKQEGTIDNPLGIFPSSHVTPAPDAVTSFWKILENIAGSPAFAVGLIILITELTAEDDEENVTQHFNNYVNLPLLVQDNAVIEAELFGEENGSL